MPTAKDAVLELRQKGHNIGDIVWRAGYPAERVFRVLGHYLPEQRDKLAEEYRDLVIVHV